MEERRSNVRRNCSREEEEKEKEEESTSATVLLTRSMKFSKSTRLKSGCCFSLYSSWAKASSWCLRMDPVEEEAVKSGRDHRTKALGRQVTRCHWL